MIEIKELSNELLVNIFDYLDMKSKLRAESVCKGWQQFIKTGFHLKTTLKTWKIREIVFTHW
jgi:hypothetical protein